MKRKKLEPGYSYQPHYNDAEGFFADKEIIFRSGGRAKVFKISSRLQVFLLLFIAAAAVWSFYSYHLYNKSGRIISYKNQELDATRDAYADLIGDFMNMHKNINEMLVLADSKKSANKKEIENYKLQASRVEDKIKQIAEEKDWVSNDIIKEKLNLNEAILQRDIAASERDELRRQINEMENVVDELKSAEMEVFDQVERIAGKEADKIKNAFGGINKALKRKGLYFNPLANRKSGKGGPYMPEPKTQLKDKALQKKISAIYKAADDLQ